MKRYNLLVFVLFFALISFGQIPSGYYNTAQGLTGVPLKTALYNIIKGHTVQSYPLWSWYDNTDLRSDGKIWDIYSDNCSFTLSSDQCGNYQNVCDCYNNEHSFPKSWFGDVSPMNSDIFHIYPTDGKVNGMRSNYPYGETSTGAVWGNGKLGVCSYPGYAGTVFEPADQYKGDLARTYFYMVTRYENVVESWETKDANGDVVLDGTSFPCFEPWALSLLLKWNAQDPVNQKEIDRNNNIYNTVQDNRNPYIDHPEYITAIWGNPSSISAIRQNSFTLSPNPAKGVITLTSNKLKNTTAKISIFNVLGQTQIEITFNNITDKLSLNVSSLKDGMYFIKITSNELTSIQQIMVDN